MLTFLYNSEERKKALPRNSTCDCFTRSPPSTCGSFLCVTFVICPYYDLPKSPDKWEHFESIACFLARKLRGWIALWKQGIVASMPGELVKLSQIWWRTGPIQTLHTRVTALLYSTNINNYIRKNVFTLVFCHWNCAQNDAEHMSASAVYGDKQCYRWLSTVLTF